MGKIKILNAYPKNYAEIKSILNPPDNAIFCYGDKIFNPSGQEIPPDIQFHEQVHIKQQQKFPSSDVWWTRYLLDKEFRLREELKAFASQLQFVKRFYPNKAVKEALNEMAENLSKNYKLDLSISQAETLIRKHK